MRLLKSITPYQLDASNYQLNVAILPGGGGGGGEKKKKKKKKTGYTESKYVGLM